MGSTCRTAKKIAENFKDALEGHTTELSRDQSERKPIVAGVIGNIKGHDNMNPTPVIGRAPEHRLTDCRNYSGAVGAAGPSNLKKGLIASEG